MDCGFPTLAYFLPVAYPRKCINRKVLKTSRLLCFAKTRGFGTQPSKKGSNTEAPRKNAIATSEPSKVSSGAQRTRIKNAPKVQGTTDGKSKGSNLDRQFLEKIESVKRSAYEQKKAEEGKFFLPIDYEAPIDSEKSKIGLGSKVGVGIAVVTFGLVFAFGDFFPSGSNIPSADNTVTQKNLSEKEKSVLEEAIQHFEETLSKSPKDPAALEGEAVTLVELGEYQRASSLLQKLLQEMPENVDAHRLLGEVNYELKDYEGSASAYKSGLSISKGLDFDSLRGLTNTLLAAKKPDEAVHVLLSLRENNGLESKDKFNEVDRKIQQIDPIQVDLLLGKAYSDWGHISDAVAVYDQLISKHPDDFRGYLAKAIILKENGKVGDAERMFIQARFFAPEKAKSLVDRYSRR